MTGNTPAAWNDPTKGGELARSQFDRGADVIFAAAGGTGVGRLPGGQGPGQAGHRRRFQPEPLCTREPCCPPWSSGSTSRARGLRDCPGRHLDSPGFTVLGLAEDGVGWALDEHNRALVSAEMEGSLDAARAEIVGGKIAVADYSAKNSCDY